MPAAAAGEPLESSSEASSVLDADGAGTRVAVSPLSRPAGGTAPAGAPGAGWPGGRKTFGGTPPPSPVVPGSGTGETSEGVGEPVDESVGGAETGGTTPPEGLVPGVRPGIRPRAPGVPPFGWGARGAAGIGKYLPAAAITP